MPRKQTVNPLKLYELSPFTVCRDLRILVNRIYAEHSVALVH